MESPINEEPHVSESIYSSLSNTWTQMVQMVRRGRIRSIGLLNCGKADLENLLANATIPPAVNRLELNLSASNFDTKYLSFMEEKRIAVQAYHFLGPPLSKFETIVAIAQYRCVEPDAVLIAYLREFLYPLHSLPIFYSNERSEKLNMG
jgi:glycerol 2-dehydrogenase (NADP+)